MKVQMRRYQEDLVKRSATQSGIFRAKSGERRLTQQPEADDNFLGIPVDEILASLENERPRKSRKGEKKPKAMEDTLSNNRHFTDLLKEVD